MMVEWFPADSPDYATLWSIPTDHEARITANVRRGVAGASVRAVCSPDRSEMLLGVWDYLCPGIAVDDAGLYFSGWEAAPSGALYVAVVVEAPDATPLEDLRAFCEVQIRRSA